MTEGPEGRVPAGPQEERATCPQGVRPLQRSPGFVDGAGPQGASNLGGGKQGTLKDLNEPN